MQRTEKKQMVDSLHAKMEKASIAVALEYKNIDAEATVALRKKLRDAHVDYKVVKNTLAKLAAKGTSLEGLSSKLEGPSAIVMGYDDVVGPAKLLQEILKAQGEKLVVKSAVVQGNLIDAAGLKALASLPGKDELRGMIVGMIAAPASKLVRLLNTPGSQLARVLGEKSRKAEKAA